MSDSEPSPTSVAPPAEEEAAAAEEEAAAVEEPAQGDSHSGRQLML